MLYINPLPSLVSFTQLLSRIVRMKRYDIAISLDKKMGLVGVKPNEYSLSILINCFSHLRLMRLGLSVFGKFFKLSFEPTSVTMNTLVTG